MIDFYPSFRQRSLGVQRRYKVKNKRTFLYFVRVGFDSHVLRFAARLISDNPEDAIRYFIIKYFLSDDTIGVFELGERNSGFTVCEQLSYSKTRLIKLKFDLNDFVGKISQTA